MRSQAWEDKVKEGRGHGGSRTGTARTESGGVAERMIVAKARVEGAPRVWNEVQEEQRGSGMRERLRRGKKEERKEKRKIQGEREMEESVVSGREAVAARSRRCNSSCEWIGFPRGSGWYGVLVWVGNTVKRFSMQQLKHQNNDPESA